jgi:hypothetical protein
MFLPKCGDNEILRGDLRRAVGIPSQSILFNIDQKAAVATIEACAHHPQEHPGAVPAQALRVVLRRHPLQPRAALRARQGGGARGRQSARRHRARACLAQRPWHRQRRHRTSGGVHRIPGARPRGLLRGLLRRRPLRQRGQGPGQRGRKPDAGHAKVWASWPVRPRATRSCNS